MKNVPEEIVEKVAKIIQDCNVGIEDNTPLNQEFWKRTARSVLESLEIDKEKAHKIMLDALEHGERLDDKISLYLGDILTITDEPRGNEK